MLTAQDRLQFGRQAVDDMYTQVAEKWLAQQAELTHVQKQFLEKALAFYQRLATEESDDPAVRFETAKAQQRVGEIQKKLGTAQGGRSGVSSGHRTLSQQLVREKPDEPQYNQGLAQTHSKLGRRCFPSRAGSPEAEQEQRLGPGDCARPWPLSSPATPSTRMNLAQSHEDLGLLLVRHRTIPRGGGGLPPVHRAFASRC